MHDATFDVQRAEMIPHAEFADVQTSREIRHAASLTGVVFEFRRDLQDLLLSHG
jgi:hypothetical protein